MRLRCGWGRKNPSRARRRPRSTCWCCAARRLARLPTPRPVRPALPRRTTPTLLPTGLAFGVASGLGRDRLFRRRCSGVVTARPQPTLQLRGPQPQRGHHRTQFSVLRVLLPPQRSISASLAASNSRNHALAWRSCSTSSAAGTSDTNHDHSHPHRKIKHPRPDRRVTRNPPPIRAGHTPPLNGHPRIASSTLHFLVNASWRLALYTSG
jgi:hypothetical protein